MSKKIVLLDSEDTPDWADDWYAGACYYTCQDTYYTCQDTPGALWRLVCHEIGLDCYSYRREINDQLRAVEGYRAKRLLLDDWAEAEVTEGGYGRILDAESWYEHCRAEHRDTCPGAVLSRLDPHGIYTPDGRKIGSSCGCEDYPCCGH